MSPLSMFMGICGALTGLIVLFLFSVWYYWRAKELAPHIANLRLLKEEIAIAQETRAREEQKMAEFRQERVLAEQKIAEASTAKQYLEQNRDRVEALRNDIETYTAKAQKASLLYQERQEELNLRQQALADLETKLAADKEKESALAIRIEAAEARVNELKAEGVRIKTDLEKLEGQRQDLSGAINELDAKRKSLEREVERLMREATEQENRRQSAAQEEAAARAKTGDLQGQAAAAQRMLSEWATTKSEDKDKWANLHLPVMAESGRVFGQVGQMEWLGKFGKMLERNGFVFSSRTLRAFHTGLLCAQESPLVVLAGISGTGKSLLPELYASALGLNFLSVPVQPRWDSPQDLFGFYNYMEGRYKATELARLLWQFDMYNNPDCEGTPPVNLVLLDEMNLARVEYYFSDLLSKLETRNGIDPNVREQRQRAEIEIESNAAGERKRLFVSPNTLFVGTMNEDESTQTLSDKVIDRSNVLRFGRPRKLNATPNKAAFLKECENLPRLSAKDWNSWRQTTGVGKDPAGRVGFLEEVLRHVVPALDAVGRPYGYRVDTAMKTYVLNYPGEKEDAVADQIEMKVLPKLNGLEIEHPEFPGLKRAMEEAIETTGDKDLLEAFERSCPAGGTFFKWQGVAR